MAEMQKNKKKMKTFLLILIIITNLMFVIIAVTLAFGCIDHKHKIHFNGERNFLAERRLIFKLKYEGIYKNIGTLIIF